MNKNKSIVQHIFPFFFNIFGCQTNSVMPVCIALSVYAYMRQHRDNLIAATLPSLRQVWILD